MAFRNLTHAMLVIRTLPLLAITATAPGQNEKEPPPPPPPPRAPAPAPPPPAEPLGQIRFQAGAGVVYQFENGLDGGGNMSVTTLGSSLRASVKLSRELDMTLRGEYQLDSYDFTGNGFGGLDPWDDIQTMRFGLIFNYRLNTDWTVFGGPIAQSSLETGANYGDSWIGGGAVGAVYRVSDALHLGLGLNIVSQLQDSVRFFPNVVVEWQIADHLRLTSDVPGSTIGRAGVELVYDLGKGWDVAFGGGYAFSRFRLDDGGPAPRGVGEDKSIPFWGRLGWKPNHDIDVDFLAGFTISGELTLEQSSGSTTTSDYDPAGFVGVVGRIRF